MATPSHVRPSRVPGKVDTPKPRLLRRAHACPDEIKFGCAQMCATHIRCRTPSVGNAILLCSSWRTDCQVDTLKDLSAPHFGPPASYMRIPVESPGYYSSPGNQRRTCGNGVMNNRRRDGSIRKAEESSRKGTQGLSGSSNKLQTTFRNSTGFPDGRFSGSKCLSANLRGTSIKNRDHSDPRTPQDIQGTLRKLRSQVPRSSRGKGLRSETTSQ
ncbi:hypothetical protein CRG98_006593 [Punica granatum]|uniref:Uncharacterized protein n=1 Tax=Punica granatum TaxID=22663 RepID=A0A2I0KX40_PUNGR|nr:hypothetical protein CRG98_006593 [Punica granatum]